MVWDGPCRAIIWADAGPALTRKRPNLSKEIMLLLVKRAKLNTTGQKVNLSLDLGRRNTSQLRQGKRNRFIIFSKEPNFFASNNDTGESTGTLFDSSTQ